MQFRWKLIGGFSSLIAINVGATWTINRSFQTLVDANYQVEHSGMQLERVTVLAGAVEDCAIDVLTKEPLEARDEGAAICEEAEFFEQRRRKVVTSLASGSEQADEEREQDRELDTMYERVKRLTAQIVRADQLYDGPELSAAVGTILTSPEHSRIVRRARSNIDKERREIANAQLAATSAARTASIVGWTIFLAVLILSLGILLITLPGFLRSLDFLLGATRRVAAGDLAARASRMSMAKPDELGELAHAFDEMVTEVARSYERAKSEAVARDMAHQAGRAEMAAGVLHNVGNALNGITVLSGLIEKRVQSSKAGKLGDAVALLKAWDSEHGSLLSRDEKGQKLLAYFEKLSQRWLEEDHGYASQLLDLRRTVHHITEVISKQQEYAKPHSVAVPCDPSDLVRDAVVLSSASLDKRRIQITERYECSERVPLDRHRVLQIVMNLIRNAQDAVQGRGGDEMRIDVATSLQGDRLKICVADNGVGITPENMPKIFQYGFTTKPHGHGFGLHNSRLLADEMGGTLTCESEGHGRGTTFVLELPIGSLAEEGRDAHSIAASTADRSA